MRLLGVLGRLPLPVIIVLAGWYGGAKWGAPGFAMNAADSAFSEAAGMIRSVLNRGDEQEQIKQGGKTAAAAVVPETQDTASVETEAGGPGLNLCNLDISNAPPADRTGRVRHYRSLVEINGVSLLMTPATKSCLSSGFGHRGYAPHRGVDYFSDQGGDVLAAADGVIREAKHRDDYGNMIVIDHGNGVYTRYAHLASFAGAVREGVGVKQGQRLGPIGRTGKAGATHLHYEIRTGDYLAAGGSFALTPVDPFALKP